MSAASDDKLFGVLAEFANPRALYQACETIRDAGYRSWDSYTPFPVHGLDKAMGLKPSKLGWLIFACGLTGASAAMLLQWWTAAVDYPLVISGKPLFSWPAFVPVMFEVMVLFSALGAVFGMLGINRLPRYHHPLFAKERFDRVTDDRFFIAIEADDPKFSEKDTRDLLKQAGATYVELVKE